MTLRIERVDGSAAEVVHAVVLEAFSARPPLDPPAEALSETVASIREALDARGGLLASVDGVPRGCLLFGPADDPALLLRRFGVSPAAQGTGVAGALVAEAARCAREQGQLGLRVFARVELPASVAFWEHHGFVPVERSGVSLEMVRIFPRTLTVPTAEDATALGERLAPLLRRGDLLVLSGELGAGKTTFTRGLGAGLDVRGDVTSPTFVIARVHPSNHDGPALVHVDAYRLGGIDELEDLDLDASLADSVTVVEWGSGMAEGLADDRLEVSIVRAVGADASEPVTDGPEVADPREVTLQPVGRRWLDTPLDSL